jgi:hypothetical protein
MSGRSRVRNGPPHAGQASSSAVAAGVKRSRQSGQDARVTNDPLSSPCRCTSAGEPSGRVASGQPTPAARTGLRDHRILQPCAAAGLEVHLVTTETEDLQTLPARTAVTPAAAAIVLDEKLERGSLGHSMSPRRGLSDSTQLWWCGGHGRPPFWPFWLQSRSESAKDGLSERPDEPTRFRPIDPGLPGRVVRWNGPSWFLQGSTIVRSLGPS